MYIKNNFFVVVFFGLTNVCIASEPKEINFLSLADVEEFINSTVNNNPTLLTLINPKIHTKKGLEELVACVNKEVFGYGSCNHPALIRIDDDLVQFVEHGVVVKYESYQQKLDTLYNNVYKMNQYQYQWSKRTHYNKNTAFFFYYLVNKMKTILYES